MRFAVSGCEESISGTLDPWWLLANLASTVANDWAGIKNPATTFRPEKKAPDNRGFRRLLYRIGLR